MKKEKLKFYEINDEIYHRNFHLVVNESREKFLKGLVEYHKIDSVKEKETKEWLDGAKGVWLHEWKPFYYLWIEKFDWSIEEQGVLAHEIRHMVDWVLHNSGIELRWENTEVGAYYTEYIYKKCLMALKNIHPKYHKK